MIAGILNVIYGIATVGNAHFFANTQYAFSSLHTRGWITIIVGIIQLTAPTSLTTTSAPQTRPSETPALAGEAGGRREVFRRTELPGVETQPPPRRSERWLEKRIERKGLRPRDAAYLIAVFWTIAVLAFGVVERLVDPKTFHSIWLGMWWAVETVTTVGYGDIVPDQTAGKIIAALLMVGGLSLIAVVTAAITSGFVSRADAQRQAAGEDPVMQKLQEIAAEVEAVKTELAHLRSTTGTDDSA